MRLLFGVLLLAIAAAAAPEREELRAKIQAMLDEAALLEQAGRADEAARLRDEATALKIKAAGDQDDPRMQALANLEKAIGALDKAGYEGMAADLRGMAERLRAEIKGARADRPDADFWRRNLDTLRIARKALLEKGRADAADVMERAIRARELMLEGRPGEAKGGPDDAQLAEILTNAGQCWREFKQPERALQCEELGNYLRHQMRKQGGDAQREKVRDREGGPDDRMARVEERLDRMERMLHETLDRLAERDRQREAEREMQREVDRRHQHEHEHDDR
jgi:hypothetical protein